MHAMGIIRKRFKLRRGADRGVVTATVDSGADITTLNLETACGLGFDPASAGPKRSMDAGESRVVGHYLRDVEITHGKRTAKLAKVFVAVGAEWDSESGIKRKPMDPHAEQLIGHDFLQAAGAELDFKNHELRGMAKIVRRPVMRNATPAESARWAAIRCPLPRRKRR